LLRAKELVSAVAGRNAGNSISTLQSPPAFPKKFLRPSAIFNFLPAAPD
jgi:hypothetical protein